MNKTPAAAQMTIEYKKNIYSTTRQCGLLFLYYNGLG